MVFVTGGATIISFLVLLTMLRTKIGEFKDGGDIDANVQDALLANSASVSTSVPRTTGSPRKPCLMYEPTTPPKYGSVRDMSPHIPCSIQEDFMSEGNSEAKCER